MNRTLAFRLGLILSAVGIGAPQASAQEAKPFRPPAVPLVTHDPYFSVWSMADRPTDFWSQHWTGHIQAMSGLVRVDGKPFRVLGIDPKPVEAMAMTGLEVSPTRTTYTFEAGGVKLNLMFLSPLLPHDIAILSRPLTYVTYEVQAIDGKLHDVALYFDVTGEWAVNDPDQKVAWKAEKLVGPATNLNVLTIGMSEPKVLGRAGDDLRIEWGKLLVAAPGGPGKGHHGVATDTTSRTGFAETGEGPKTVDDRMPRPAKDQWPVLAHAINMGKVGPNPSSWTLMLAYDEEYAIEYFGRKLRPLWTRYQPTSAALLAAGYAEYTALERRCREFDQKLMADLTGVGGQEYARLCALAYRQCWAAHTLVEGPEGMPLLMSKENFSNGCIATVDVTYPSSPMFLLFNPEMLKAMLRPVLDYANSGRWKFPFAPHDLGTYPLANGQVYGGGEKGEKDQMPVEESGNMLIMMAALARAEGNADFSQKYWGEITRWAEYLRDKGLDPENQLCTDDFAGHMAHNTNLSLKAIVALGGYAQLCEKVGKSDDAKTYRKLAKEMANRWVEMARDGDHYKLAFDKPGTWSQKYNLVWDDILGLDLFPPEVEKAEVAYYLSHQNEYGLPLDNRSTYTKLDWIVWTATLAHSKADFEALLQPVYRFADKSESRVPLSDWYWTDSGKMRGFQARSVVGGVFIKMLADPATWRSWQPSKAR